MSNPQSQSPAKPQGATTFGFDRRLPTAFFLAVVTDGFPHPALAAGRHVYVSRTASGRYRVLGQGGVALMVAEGVAARHLKRLKNQAGEYIRVRDQQHQDERFCEAFYGRGAVA